MFKKFICIGALALAMVAGMSSCGNGDKKGDSAATQEEVKLDPKEVTVTAVEESDGTLAEYISLKEGEYTINFVDAEWGGKYKAEVAMNVTAQQMPGFTDDMYLQGSSYKLVFLDENGAPLAGEITASTSDMDKLLKSGGSSAITFSTGNYLEPDVVENIVSKAKTVKLAASGNLTEMSSSSSSSGGGISEDDDEGDGISESDESSSSSSSNDVDEFLDEYDQYMTKAISVYKKVANGDPTAAIEYASLYGDIVSLSNKLEGMKSEMTSAQLARFNKILAKQTNSLKAM